METIASHGLRPLHDPLAFLANAILLLDVAMLGLAAVLLANPFDGASIAEEPARLVAVLVALGNFVLVAGVYLLLHPGRPVNCLYLRSFQIDRESSSLLAAIRAVAPRDLRVSGIRPPGLRSGVATRWFWPLIVALRYGGSNYCDLEAGDDWLRRLLATCANARLAIIDLRRVSRSVAQEARMCWLQLGAERCVFVVDNWSTAADARRFVEQATGAELAGVPVQVIRWPGDDFGAALRELTQLVAAAPREHGACRPQALEYATSVVEPARSHRLHAAGRHTLGVLALGAGSLLLLWQPWIASAASVCSVPVLWSAVGRASEQRRAEAVWRRSIALPKPGTPWRRRLGMVLIASVSVPCFAMAVVFGLIRVFG